MDGKDAVAIPWMAKFERTPWPTHIAWLQDDVTVDRFYWLINPAPKKGQRIVANVTGQTITLDSTNIPSITLRLNDQLIDLNKEISVVRKAEKKVLFQVEAWMSLLEGICRFMVKEISKRIIHLVYAKLTKKH